MHMGLYVFLTISSNYIIITHAGYGYAPDMKCLRNDSMMLFMLIRSLGGTGGTTGW